MSTVIERTIDLHGARYTVRKMTTRGYLALMDMLGRQPEALAEVLDAARSARQADAVRALGPALAELIDIVLTHCVRPVVDADALPPQDARQLLSASREMNPLKEILEELHRFFEVMTPVVSQAETAARPPTGGSG